MKKSVVLAALAGAALSSAAFGQAGTGFTISDGNTFFTNGASPTTTTGSNSADFRVTGAAGTDHLFGNWWWYRVNGVDASEISFNNQTGPTVVAGNTASRNYNFPAFSARLDYQVNSTGPDSGILTETLTIIPLTQISLNIWNYADFFVNGQDAGDTADVANPAAQIIRDVTSGRVLNFNAIPPAASFEVGPFNSIRGRLTNAVIDNLTNTNNSVAAGSDIEGAFQWEVVGIPGQVITLQETFRIPAPGALSLIGLGGLIAARRRRA